MSRDEHYMQRAFDLARLGLGNVSPNPLVGCVIVCDDSIIGEGWHMQYGSDHAEVNAIKNVDDPTLLPQSTLYVNLEPCSHFGKTPPCVDLILDKKIKKVVVSNTDPNPVVNGKGIERLKENGVNVEIGILEKGGSELNHRFFTYIQKGRPYIMLKWAQTADGFIAKKNFDSKWISNEQSRQLVHKWRAEEDAVLVGTRTAQHDNPSLHVKNWTGRNPTRVVFDRFLRLNDKLNLFDQSQNTLCYNVLKHEEHHNLSLIRVDEKDFIQHVAHDLFQRKIQSLIVEGGSQTLELFLESGLWDEARVFISPRSFEDGIEAPILQKVVLEKKMIGDDELMIYRNPQT
jgi:diaminohydroxyphosphoribosylaminopyrimidine deaminase/5-amino-6-(5-phosphoribosylamino)uracil reductase